MGILINMEEKIIDIARQIATSGDSSVFDFDGCDLECGVGDDCAVIDIDSHSKLLFSSDSLVEDVHFSSDYFSPEDLGWKLGAVNLSDIASMGGWPVFFMCSLHLPENTSVEWINGFYCGLTDILKKYKVRLIGGDTVRASQICLSGTVIGEMGGKRAIYRSGAKERDDIWVSGKIGASLLGFKCLRGEIECGEWSEEIKRHLRPLPRLELAKELSNSQLLNSAIDLSDGLLKDAHKLTKSSKLNAELDLDALSYSSKELSALSVAQRAAGGEDFELLFTSSQNKREEIIALGRRLSLPVNRIGKIKPQEIDGEFFVSVKYLGKKYQNIKDFSSGFSLSVFEHFKSEEI